MDFLIKIPYLRFWIPLNLLYIILSVYVFQTSRHLWRFFSIVEYIKLIASVGTFSLFFLALLLFFYPETGFYADFSFSVMLFCLFVFALSIPRFIKRVIHFPLKRMQQCKRIHVSGNEKKSTLIIGAGQAGHKILREIQDYAQNQYHVIGFIDDDPAKKNTVISGLPVLGNSSQMPSIIQKHCIQTIIFAIPSISNRRLITTKTNPNRPYQSARDYSR
jgi:FlaA1/EpsC-like NDP-sugar epimerase